MDIHGKKLVVLGGIQLICKLVENARARGAYVIVADYLPNSPAKALADEAWLVSTTDTDKLAGLCLENHVDGVIAGYDDFNIINAQRLSERIGRPFYANAYQISQTMDKANFKALCRASGVPSVPEYQLDEDLSRECLDSIRYPVIIKPVDRSGSIGISICHNEAELIEAHRKACGSSRSGRVILEKYMVGDEVGVFYTFQDGQIFCAAMHDRLLQQKNNNEVRISEAYIYPSKYAEIYMEKENETVIRMFRSLGITNGTLFLQGCVEDGTVYFYEAGFRLNGSYPYQLISHVSGFNPMEMLVNYSLTGKEADESVASKANPVFDKACCALSILVRPGTIGALAGLDEIAAFPETVDVNRWYSVGETIGEDFVGTQKQIVVRFNLAADDREKLADVIRRVYSVLRVDDTEGRSMMLTPFDTGRLF